MVVKLSHLVACSRHTNRFKMVKFRDFDRPAKAGKTTVHFKYEKKYKKLIGPNPRESSNLLVNQFSAFLVSKEDS